MSEKKEAKFGKILKVMDDFCKKGEIPSIRDIAAVSGISKSMVHEYLKELQDKSVVRYDIETSSYITHEMDKISNDQACLANMGSISCGPPEEAGDENVQGYLKFPRAIVGKGDFYMLTASGQSMQDIGIDNGDIVIIKKQNTANDGDIIVARVEGSNNFTLKRFVKGNKGTYLHPENKSMKDMRFNEIEVFGVAVKIIKDI